MKIFQIFLPMAVSFGVDFRGMINIFLDASNGHFQVTRIIWHNAVLHGKEEMEDMITTYHWSFVKVELWLFSMME